MGEFWSVGIFAAVKTGHPDLCLFKCGPPAVGIHGHRQILTKAGSRFARMPTHAMRPHEWTPGSNAARISNIDKIY
jgi:hypothetical protein